MVGFAIAHCALLRRPDLMDAKNRNAQLAQKQGFHRYDN